MAFTLPTPTPTPKDDDTDIHKPQKGYVSKEGFVTTKVLRGYTEVETLHTIATTYNGIMCGGYVRYMCSPAKSVERAGDVDIYFDNLDNFNACKDYLVQVLQMSVKHENVMSVTFTKPVDTDHILVMAPVIQLIKPVREGKIVASGSMEDILTNFDFTVVRCGLIDSRTAMVDADFEHDEPRKILRLKNIHCPVSSTLRCMKYAKKGYWLPPMQAIHLFLDWDNRSLEWRQRLYEFLKSAQSGEGLSRKEIDELEGMMRVD